MATTSAVARCAEPARAAVANRPPDDPTLAVTAGVVVRHIGEVRKRLAGRAVSGEFQPTVVDGCLAELNEAVLAIL